VNTRTPLSNVLFRRTLELSERGEQAEAIPLRRVYPDTTRRAGISSRRWTQWRYVTTDLCCLFLSFAAIASLRFASKPVLGPVHGSWTIFKTLEHATAYYLLFAGMSLGFAYIYGLYETTPTRSFENEMCAVVKSVAWATLILSVLIYLLDAKEVSSVVLAECALSSALLLTTWRVWERKLVERRVDAGLNVRHILIVGAGKTGRAVAEALSRNKQLGTRVCGFLDHDHLGEPSVLGSIEDLPRVARAVFADEIIVTNPSERDLAQKAIAMARANRLDVKVVPELFDTMGHLPVIEYLGVLPVMALHEEPIPAARLFIKRCLDVIVAGFALAALSPVLVLTAIAIALGSRGPIFYGSARLGKKGREFRCLKFRTMVANADDLKESLRKGSGAEGPFFQMCGDPRVTRIGAFLRKYSIDELPQLWNVLKGDMSLVGPRPHPLDDWEVLTTELENKAAGNFHELQHLRLLEVTPGITGLRQIIDRRCAALERNLALDLEYIENWSLRMDMRILIKTVAVVLAGSGA
jgi:exopolysaccharide biosynthesis polyprenyl glycosylphosphotransferase